MTDHHHPEFPVPERDRPTQPQMRLLRALAAQSAGTFAYPRTKSEASTEIRRLQRERAGKGRERGIRGAYDASERVASATAYRSDEITGYGATARWA
ncbi:MAG TPA: hypothetical protein VF549_08110 [Solirubrobacteraceae bacterium]|jgi:hypothetical protein